MNYINYHINHILIKKKALKLLDFHYDKDTKWKIF